MSNRDGVNTSQGKLLTVKETADYLRVSRVTIWRWCQRGSLPAFRIGRSWRIRADKLLELGDLPEPAEESFARE